MRKLKKETEQGIGRSIARECAYTAVFVAITIAVQFALSFVPGVELVTVFIAAYSAVMGVRRATTAATTFSLLRQIIFGFEPRILTLYLIYYNLLAIVFALSCKARVKPVKRLLIAVTLAVVCTVCFTLLDDAITPIWYGYSARLARLYFYASLPFMGIQAACAGITVACLFQPMVKLLQPLKFKLDGKNISNENLS